MTNARPPATLAEADPSARSEDTVEMAGMPASAAVRTDVFETAGHAALFDPLQESRCDACGAALLSEPDEREPYGYGVRGRGVYLWSRGDEIRFEDAPLCASCASALGMVALARWEIEEEEG